MKTEQEIRDEYNKTDWGKLLIRYGFDPFNTESSARRVAEKAAQEIKILEARLDQQSRQ